MEQWFRERFEDPAQRTPYESAEGGYIWIFGGPYDAKEELLSRFEGVVPNDVIDELADDLRGENWDWAPTDHDDRFDEGLFDAVRANARAHASLEDALRTLTELRALQVPETLEKPYHRLLFANAITALETYLSDTFINRVLENDTLLQKYLDTEPNFKERKVAFKDVLRQAPQVRSAAKKELLDVAWHNLGKVKAMYKAVLDIDLGDTADLFRAIEMRHDIVHRNGRTKEGGAVSVSAAGIAVLLSHVEQLALRVEHKLDYGVEIDADDDPKAPF